LWICQEAAFFRCLFSLEHSLRCGDRSLMPVLAWCGRGRLARVFAAHAGSVHDHPFLFLALPLAVAAIAVAGAGIANAVGSSSSSASGDSQNSAAAALGLKNVVASPRELWVDPLSREAKEADDYEDKFGAFFRIESVVAVARGSVSVTGDESGEAGKFDPLCCTGPADFEAGKACCGGEDALESVLTQEAVAELHFLDEAIKAAVGSSTGVRFADVCAHVYPNSPCIESSPLMFWGLDANGARLQAIRTNLNGTFSGVPQALSQVGVRDAFGQGSTAKSIVNLVGARGGLEVLTPDPSQFTVASAEAFMITYLVRNDKQSREEALDWELAFVEAVREFNDERAEHLHFFFAAERSVSDALAEQVTADAVFVVLAYVLMVLYTMVALAKRKLVQSQALLGCGGVASVILALVLGLAFASTFTPFTAISLQVLPFLMLGVGVNDVFVLARGCWRVGRAWTRDESRRLFVSAMEHVGPSVSLTSVANFLAFIASVGTSAPAIRWFAIQAAVAVFSAWFVLLTGFSALIVLDAARSRRGLADMAPCVAVPENKCGHSEVEEEVMGAAPEDEERPGFLASVFRKTTPLLLTRVGAIVVGVLTVLLLGLAAGGMSQLERGLGVGEVVPKGSAVGNLFVARSVFFTQSGAPVYIVTPHEDDFDYTAPENQKALSDLSEMLSKSPWLTDPIVNWAGGFRFWANVLQNRGAQMCCGVASPCDVRATCFDERFVPPDKFHAWLREYLVDETLGRYSYFDVVFSDDGRRISGSRVMSTSIGLNSSQAFVDAIQSVRALVDDASLDGAYPYSIFYMFFAPYLTLTREVVVGVLASLAAIFLTTWFFLRALVPSVITVCIIGLVVFDVAGLMWFLEIQLNPLSVVNLIVCTGLSVELTAHIAQVFQLLDSLEPRERVTRAMVDIGASVANGGLTTLLGVLMLAFASYSVFQVYYFRMYLLIVLVGLFHAFAVLPLALWIYAVRSGREKSARGSSDGESSDYADLSTNTDDTRTATAASRSSSDNSEQSDEVSAETSASISS
jgi:predicted RND superfamily exporter protein